MLFLFIGVLVGKKHGGVVFEFTHDILNLVVSVFLFQAPWV